MKKIILFFILITAPICSQNNYKVLFVKGDVYKNNTVIKNGDILKAEDKINFNKKKGILKVCYSNCSKIKILSEHLFKKTKSKTIKDYTTYYESLGVRANDDLDITDFRSLLKNQKIAIIDSLVVSVKDIDLEINNSNFFYVRFKHLSKDVNKKLLVKKDKITFSKSIFKVTDYGLVNPDSLPISILYYDSLKEKSKIISEDFHPVFINKKNLRKEFYKSFPKVNALTKEDKLTFLKNFIHITYHNTFFNQKDLEKILINKQ